MRFIFNILPLFLVLSPTSARIGDEGGEDQHDHDARFLRSNGKKIENQFIVKLSKSAKPTGILNGLLHANKNARIKHVYTSAFHGFAVSNLPEAAMLNFMRRHPDDVIQIEEDSVVQKSLEWGLDRIDDRSGLDGSYNNDFSGSGVDIYIVDTGIRTSHDEFGGRFRAGQDFTGEGNFDGDGHGTHCAGTAAGSTYGVAKGATVIPVKVLDSSGSGSDADVIAGLDYVRIQHQNANGSAKSVANLSLGGSFSASLNTAVENAVAAGVVVVVAAGNENEDACNSSPASAGSAITVGATTTSDVRSDFSNFGSCVDIFAPGSGIKSAVSDSDTATGTWSGTSMAAPHVSGAFALLLESGSFPSAVAAGNTLLGMATENALSDVNGSPNKLLYTDDIKSSGPAPTPPAPTPTPPAPTPTAPAPTPTPPAPTSTPPSGTIPIEIHVVFDNFPEETSFELWSLDSDGVSWTFIDEYYPEEPYPPSMTVTEDLADGYYSVDFLDSYGDGICCAEGNGFFILTDVNASWDFATGGEFGGLAMVEFEISGGQVVDVVEYY